MTGRSHICHTMCVGGARGQETTLCNEFFSLTFYGVQRLNWGYQAHAASAITHWWWQLYKWSFVFSEGLETWEKLNFSLQELSDGACSLELSLQQEQVPGLHGLSHKDGSLQWQTHRSNPVIYWFCRSHLKSCGSQWTSLYSKIATKLKTTISSCEPSGGTIWVIGQNYIIEQEKKTSTMDKIKEKSAHFDSFKSLYRGVE